jgi:hypothetical protein
MEDTMRFRIAMSLLALSLSAGPALAGHHGGNADERRARMEAKCAENPERCEKMKARWAEAKAKCEADPAACEARKAAMKERRAEWKAQCAADPVACEQKKAEMKAKWQERQAAQP